MKSRETDNSHISSLRDLVFTNSEFLQYSKDLQVIDHIISNSKPKDKKESIGLLRSIQISSTTERIDMSVARLSNMGFDIRTSAKGLSISRPNRNTYTFTTQLEATKEQCALSGYYGSKPVFLNELGNYIDPYRLGEFHEWLVLQQHYIKHNLPSEKTILNILSPKSDPTLYLANQAVHVFMGDVVIGNIGKIETWGLGPCIGVAVLGDGFGSLAHISSFEDHIESINLVKKMIASEGYSSSNTRCALFGGNCETAEDNIYLMPILSEIRQTMADLGFQLLADKTGPIASQVTVDIDSSTISFQNRGEPNFQTI